MLRVLLPVDGSKSAVRAAQKLIETLGWYKERPRIDLLAVHLPVPRVPNMSVVVPAANDARPAPAARQRKTSTGIALWVRTFCVSLPRTTPAKPRRPCEAMQMRSHFFLLATAMICA